jgi:hypothetical protein
MACQLRVALGNRLYPPLSTRLASPLCTAGMQAKRCSCSHLQEELPDGIHLDADWACITAGPSVPCALAKPLCVEHLVECTMPTLMPYNAKLKVRVAAGGNIG